VCVCVSVCACVCACLSVCVCVCVCVLSVFMVFYVLSCVYRVLLCLIVFVRVL
jgi:hypothetical protein